MNPFIGSSFALILFFLPGIVYRKTYYSGVFSRQYVKDGYSAKAFSIVIPSVIIHAALWYFSEGKYYSVFDEIIEGTEVKLDKQLGVILGYSFMVTFFGALIGFSSKWLVRYFKLDVLTTWLRYENDWHYKFTGEILDFPNVPGEAKDKDFTQVDVLVDTADGSQLYSGILSSYDLAQNGGLDKITLESTVRFFKQNGKTVRKEIPGRLFVIPYTEVKNLNLTYVNLSKKPHSNTTTALAQDPPDPESQAHLQQKKGVDSQ